MKAASLALLVAAAPVCVRPLPFSSWRPFRERSTTRDGTEAEEEEVALAAVDTDTSGAVAQTTSKQLEPYRYPG